MNMTLATMEEWNSSSRAVGPGEEVLENIIKARRLALSHGDTPPSRP